MKKNTFEDEFNWLSRHLPDALTLPKQEEEQGGSPFTNMLEILNSQLENSIESKEEEFLVNQPPQHKTEISNLESSKLSFESLFQTLQNEYNSNREEIPESVLSDLMSNLGREAFGMYLPMHFFFQSKETPWGIYLFPDAIMSRANKLYNDIGKRLGLSLKQVQYAYSYAVFRHQLFHHQVERFSTKYEILSNQVNFKKYKENVNIPTRGTYEWLEEALAEATVLNSVHVSRNIEMNQETFKKLYEFDLKGMPPGYRDYHCDEFGGTDKAHQLFASQIIQCKKDVTPAASTTFCSVSANEFNMSWKDVPIYMMKIKNPRAIDSPRQVVEDNYKLF